VYRFSGLMSDIYATVRQAIVDRRQIIATYDGHVRKMCPHAIGTKNGRPQALFFQFGGTSGSDLPPGGEWRCLPLEGLDEVVSQPGEWHTAPNYSEFQTCIDVIEVKVPY
jgi:hypothetical protein